MRRGRSACASLRSMLMNGVMPMPPAIITMARSGSSCRLIVPVGPTIRTRAGRSGRERLFVGALAHAGGDRQPVLVGRGCEREAALAVVARAWKVLRQKEVYRFTRREREPVRLFEMEGARSFGDLLAAHQLAVIFAFDACHDVSPLCAGLREQAMRRCKILMRPSKNGSLRVFSPGLPALLFDLSNFSEPSNFRRRVVTFHVGRSSRFGSGRRHRGAQTSTGSSTRSSSEGSSFSGLFTRMEIGHMVIGSDG